MDGAKKHGLRVHRCVMCGQEAAYQCPVCKTVHYCSSACQKIDWQYHVSEECNDTPPLTTGALHIGGQPIMTIDGLADLTPEEQDERSARLETNVLRLYHQTSEEAADSIIAGQEVRLGSIGYAGAGIYFAVTPEDTDLKSHTKGIILVATVRLGKVFHLKHSDRELDGDKLLEDGHDSVYLKRPTGPEYVIYFPDQVGEIQKHERKRPTRKRAPLRQIGHKN